MKRRDRVYAAAMKRLALFLSSIVALGCLISPQALAAENQDQSSLPAGIAQGWVKSTSTWGQGFTAGITGQLTRVDMPLTKSGTATNLTVSIQTVTAGQIPTGVVLSSTSVDMSAIAADPASSTVAITFSTPTTVQAGTEYAIVLSSTDAANSVAVYGGSPYAGGVRTINGVIGGIDLAFTTYVTTPDSGPTPPGVLQQFGRSSTQTCDELAPASLNWGGSSSGNWGHSWAQWMNSGQGGEVCTRMLDYDNNLGRWVAH